MLDLRHRQKRNWLNPVVVGISAGIVVLVVVIAVVLISGPFTIKDDGANNEGLARETNAYLQARGLYLEYCASCHGAQLEGQPNWRARRPSGRLPAPPHDETGHTWHHSDGVLFGITKFGPARFAGLDDYESDMPAFENVMSDDEIRSVIEFIKASWPPAISARQAQLNR